MICVKAAPVGLVRARFFPSALAFPIDLNKSVRAVVVANCRDDVLHMKQLTLSLIPLIKKQNNT